MYIGKYVGISTFLEQPASGDAQGPKVGKTNKLNVFGSYEPKGLNRITIELGIFYHEQTKILCYFQFPQINVFISIQHMSLCPTIHIYCNVNLCENEMRQK